MSNIISAQPIYQKFNFPYYDDAYSIYDNMK